MNVHLSDFFKLYQLSTGRRIFALRRMREHAVRLGARALVERIDRALAHDETTRRLDLAWSGARRRRASGGAVAAVDNRMDRALGGLRDVVRALTAGAAPDDAIYGLAQQLLDRIFPAGVHAVTTLPVVDQLAAVETIVELLQGELAPLVAELNIQTNVRRVIELAREYRAVLEERPASVSFAEVQSARHEGHERFCSIIGMIVGTYYRADLAEHMDARDALLEPVLEQNEAVRVYLRARRPIVDVNPETGAPASIVDDGQVDVADADELDAAPVSNPVDPDQAVAADDGSVTSTAS